MCLFKRASKPAVPANGQGPSPDGHPPEGEPAKPERVPEPAAGTDEASAVDESPSVDKASAEPGRPADGAASGDAATGEVEPEIDGTATITEAIEASSRPPAGPPPPDPDDEGRISATDALAPSRRPGGDRFPGAAIGDE